MGFFSALCEGCNHPLLPNAAVGPSEGGTMNHDNSWMTEAVAILPEGTVARGQYNGYGDIGSTREAVGLQPSTVWHTACWSVAGTPDGYRGESSDAPDQGFFFEDADHDVARPATQADVDAARAYAASQADVDAARAYAAEPGTAEPGTASPADPQDTGLVRVHPEHAAGFRDLLIRVERTPGLASPTEHDALRAYLGLPA